MLGRVNFTANARYLAVKMTNTMTALRSAGAGKLSPKLTVKIESQVWHTSQIRIAAEADIHTASPVNESNGPAVPLATSLSNMRLNHGGADIRVAH